MRRISTKDFTEERYAMSRGYLSMQNGKEGFRRGQYHHPQGIVQVYETITFRGERTSLYLTRNGLAISREWQTAWGDRTISRLAREFIEEVSNER